VLNFEDAHLHLQTIALATVPLIASEMGRKKQADSYRLLYFRAGSCQITLEGHTYELHGGDICFLRPGTPYITRPLCANQVANFSFTVNGQSIAHTFADYPLLNKPFVVSCPSAADWLEKVIEESIFTKPMHHQQETLLLRLALNDMLRSKAQSQTTESASGKMGKLCRYVDAHITEDITVASLANAFSYHPTYLNTLFRRHLGKSAHDYITGRKLSGVTHMLRTTDLTVAEIAQLYQFSDSSHLARVYRKHTGKSPQQERKIP
jgi:AraC-like DNA-binding protein